ncbi:MAG TPA: multiheme c-type cytochrome [Polyangia bacterium]|nr:multiheme c-type cytochrome [Polyangia bacterium]
MRGRRSGPGAAASSCLACAACALLAAAAASCTRQRPGGSAAHADGAAAASSRAPAPPAEPIELALLYSANVRGQVAPPAAPPSALGGLARRATLVDRARLQAKAIVQVDAGDFLPALDDPAFAAPAAFERRARLVLAAYQRMDVDAVTLSPRELSIEPQALRRWVREAKLPVVLANLKGDDGKPAFPPGRLITAGGHKVGVLGVTETGGENQTVNLGRQIMLEDPIAAAVQTARALRADGAELVIALVNAPIESVTPRALAGTAGIDVVVIAHGDGSEVGAAKGEPTALMASLPAGNGYLGRIDARPAAAGAGGWRLAPRALALDRTVADQFGTGLLISADSTTILGLPPPRGKKPPAAPAKGPVVWESWTYASSRACGYCHERATKQWETTDHAHAMTTLKNKGHDRDPACVGCHSVAWLQPGGTVNLDTLTLNFTDVGCESCHGPSAAHVRAPDYQKKAGTVRTVDPIICLGCHTPDQNQGPFDYAVALKEVLGPGHGVPDVPVPPGGGKR